VGRDEFRLHGAARDQEMREPVEQGEVALPPQGHVKGRGHGGFGAARVEDDDLGGAPVHHRRAAT